MSFFPGILSAASPHDDVVATLHGHSLVAHKTVSPQVVYSRAVKASLADKCKILRFYRAPRGSSHSACRILLASDTEVEVFDLSDGEFHASISSACVPTSRMAHVAFVTVEEVLVIADFNSKATLWNLRTGLGTEVRDPKGQRGSAGYSIRPATGHLAILTRVGVKDIVVILEPESRMVEVSFTLESQDAQCIRWSDDGKWLAVWDSPGMGSALWIYTADGQLYRSWFEQEVQENTSLGIRLCEWDKEGAWLFAGMGDGRVVGLGGRNFMPRVKLFHPTMSISVPADARIYQEEMSISPTSSRNYALAPSPCVPPGPASGTKSAAPSSAAAAPAGIVHLSRSPSGRYLASVSSSTPSTLWVHTISPSPRTHTVLIHHNAVRGLEWHPTRPDLLLIHCASPPTEAGEKTRTAGGDSSGRLKHWAHVWGAELPEPIVVGLDAVSSDAGKTAAPNPAAATAISWVPDPLRASPASSSAPGLLLSTPHGFSTKPAWRGTESGGCSEYGAAPARIPAAGSGPGSPGKPSAPITGEGPEDAFDEGYSMDLSPVHLRAGAAGAYLGFGEDVDVDGNGDGDGEEGEDDTFAFRKQGPAAGAGAGGARARAGAGAGPLRA